jgi:predicted aconitase
MSAYRSSLSGAVAVTPSNPEQIRAMAAAAWKSRGVVMVNVEQLTDEWERQMVTNLATRLYGPRLPGARGAK